MVTLSAIKNGRNVSADLVFDTCTYGQKSRELEKDANHAELSFLHPEIVIFLSIETPDHEPG